MSTSGCFFTFSTGLSIRSVWFVTDAVERFANDEPIFDWINDEWGKTFLPWIRMASVVMTRPRDRVVLQAENKELLGELMTGSAQTRTHLAGLIELIDAATAKAGPALI